MKEFLREKWWIIAAAVVLIAALVTVSFLVSRRNRQNLLDARRENERKIPFAEDANPARAAGEDSAFNEYTESGIANEMVLGDATQYEEYHKVYVTYLFKNGYIGEDVWALPPVNYMLVKHGEPLNIVNEVHDNYRTSWPTIHVDSVEEDMDFLVRYYNTGCYRSDYIEHLATHRKVMLDREYLGNGFVPNPPSVINEFEVGERYCYELSKYRGYDAGTDEIGGTVGTDVAPEDYIYHKATYEWNGDSVGRPFPNALMVFYRFGGTGYECAVREPEIYWLEEGEPYNLQPQLTAGYRLKQGCFSGVMGDKTEVLVVEYELDLEQEDGIMLLTTSIPEIANRMRLQRESMK